jgi:hypothetical protein
MGQVQQLPRVLVTGGLMFLCVFAIGVRPSCICANGTLCVFCPKLMVAPAASRSGCSFAESPSCAKKSCCRTHALSDTLLQLPRPSELAGSTCNDRDCLVIQPVAPTIPSPVEDPTGHLNSSVASLSIATLSPDWPGTFAHVGRFSESVGPPRKLIVLFQRWRI